MKKTLLPLILLMLLPSSSYASNAGGFVAGLSHPVLGFDHLLAMLSVGILSAQMGGRSIWTVPATFVIVMLFGGMLGIQGWPLFLVESGIAFSVLALGIALSAEKKLSALIAMIFVGGFALFHGYAHGSEIPSLANPVDYATGFILGTACLHIMGVLIGLLAEKLQHGRQLLRYIGAGIAGIGFHLLIL
ncbi:MAG: urease accessory protein UreJ [Gammaproteobacteria bacterium]|nr:MAG: urease accessory protein UreJ [Gammaproteobacteria bacterium]